MATLTDILAEVYAITKRPDLSALSTRAVKAATLKAHNSDFYARDLFETGIQFDASLFDQSLDYKSLLPTYRALKYVRKYDAVNDVAGQFFDVITTEQILDEYQVTKEDVVYLAGVYLQFKSSTEFQYVLLGCYLNPVLTDDGYSSWIANDYPDAIISETIRNVYKVIGFDEQASQYEKLVAEQMALLRLTNIQTVGY